MAGTRSEFRFRRWAGRVTFVVGVSLLCLLAAEAIARLSVDSIPRLDLDSYRKSGEGQLLLRPAVTRRHSTRHWDVTVSINEEGWRDSPGLGSAGDSVVLGLGDSFAFGWGVELEDSMLFLLEQQLTGRHRVRLLKAGVPGTGPGDQLRLLQTLGPKYQPSAVVLIFFVGNDFVDVQMGGARQFQVESGLLVRRDLSQETANPLSPCELKPFASRACCSFSWGFGGSGPGPTMLQPPNRSVLRDGGMNGCGSSLRSICESIRHGPRKR